MNNRRRKIRRSLYRQIQKGLLVPVHIAINLGVSLRDLFQVSLAFFGVHPQIKKSRNVDFDRAGRVSLQKPRLDLKAELNLRRAHSVREREIVNQVRFENRMLSRDNCVQAEKFREEMKSESVSVSSGAIVNHLAKVQRRHSDPPKSDRKV